jgi:uncharacterized membrane protein
MLKSAGKIFLTGLLTLLPIVATLYFAAWMLALLEGVFGEPVISLLPEGWYRAGMGLVLAVATVFATGLLMHGFVFRRLFAWFEWLVLSVPLVRSVYSAVRDFVGLFAGDEPDALQVVSIEVPGNMRLLGFVTRADLSDLPAGAAAPGDVAVYLPMSYGIGGYTVFVARSAVTPVAMSREDAMKFVLTGGLKASSAADQASGERPS